MNKNNYGWICPKCGRVHAPFIMGCSNCNNNEIKPDPCIITPPWQQDYSKYKSEVATDPCKCDKGVTIEDVHRSEEIAQQESNDDMWPTEQEVKDHLKYIKEQTESEKNIIDNDMSYWKCSRCGKIHLVFPEGGCECGAPLEYLIYTI